MLQHLYIPVFFLPASQMVKAKIAKGAEGQKFDCEKWQHLYILNCINMPNGADLYANHLSFFKNTFKNHIFHKDILKTMVILVLV